MGEFWHELGNNFIFVMSLCVLKFDSWSQIFIKKIIDVFLQNENVDCVVH